MKVPRAKVVEDPETRERILAELWVRMKVDKPREGVHLSDLIYCLKKGWNMRRFDAMPGGRTAFISKTKDQTVLVWMVGNSHEAIIGRDKCKGETITVDGIQCTPDFWDIFGTAKPELMEMKSTRKSSKKTLDEMEHYHAQVAGYAAGYNRANPKLKLTEGRVLVLHTMGDYSRDHPPEADFRIWLATWTLAELKAWWAELCRRRDTIIGVKEPPMDDLSPMWEWECALCDVREAIGCPGNAAWQLEQIKQAAKKQRQEVS